MKIRIRVNGKHIRNVYIARALLLLLLKVVDEISTFLSAESYLIFAKSYTHVALHNTFVLYSIYTVMIILFCSPIMIYK